MTKKMPFENQLVLTVELTNQRDRELLNQLAEVLDRSFKDMSQEYELNWQDYSTRVDVFGDTACLFANFIEDYNAKTLKGYGSFAKQIFKKRTSGITGDFDLKIESF